MKRLTMIGVALVAVFAMGAIFAASASATSAPWWAINGTRLAEGKTHNIQAKAVTAFVLSTALVGVKIECKKLKLKEGVLLGSSETNPGTDNEVVEFSECALKEGNGFPECELEGTTITTNSLKSELVERNETGKAKILLTEFFPAKGVKFVTLHFKGKKCTTLETEVTGQVAAENTTDNALEETVELGSPVKEATSGNVRFPATPIKKVILVKAGVASEVELETLQAFADPSVQTGTSLILLANAKFESEETTKWSALP